MAQIHQTQCLICRQALVGRSDKKYCSDQCRAQASNLKKRAEPGEKFIQHINMVLRKNRSILRLLSPLGKTTTRQEYLVAQGFDFNHCTHLYTAKNGNIYHFCYDYGYLALEQEKVLIVNWQPYMKKS